ncbi:MAG: hypothetical protein IJA75_02275, partial [Oscillospiraceae bacterium]|nr:hypothetical protein [Oscillospiraceae bacterium]
LPDINQVWTNKETYPYAYLIDYPSEWCLTLMSATLTFNGKQYVSGSASYVSYQLDSAGTSWVFRKSGTSSGVGYSTCLWASQDLLYKDGTVCLAASEPVAADPLYNGVRLPDINPSWTAWGKTAYPYAYLIDYPSEWCLILMSATLTFNGTKYVSGSASYVSFQLNSAGTAWVYRTRGSTSGARYSTCLWASQDLLNTDGTVCLAASEPVVAAYLYNGVQLPDINEVWTDTAAYPYGYLVGDPDEWSLVFMSTGLSFDGTRYVSGSASYVRYKLDSAGTAWIYDGQGTTGGAAYPNCLWASKDLLYAGGTVCLAASEPVPVYE